MNIMKKILFRIGILTSVFWLAGCDDFFELLPQEALVQDEYWKKEQDVRQVLFGAYSAAGNEDLFYWLMGEVRGDMVEYDGTKGSYRSFDEGYLNPGDAFFKWGSYYSVINLCNYVLDFTDKVDDPTFSSFDREAYKAEALFLRSLEYFYLVRMFKDVPLVLESSQNDNQNFYLPQSPEDSVLNQIIRDLKLASKSIPVEYPQVLEKRSRATVAAVNALLADVYLWKEDYQKCVEHCDLILADEKYLLLPATQIFENYYPIEFPYSQEVIFEFYKDQASGQLNSTLDLTFLSSLGIRFLPTYKAIDLFTDPRESFRQEATVVLFSDGTGRIWKYAGSVTGGTSTRSGLNAYSANWIVYRLADIILMKAEALNQLGQFQEATDMVNIVRNRVFLENISNPDNKTVLEDIILEERAKELAFEGKRYWDLLRFGRRNNYARKQDFINIIIAKLPVNQQQVLANKLNDPNGWYCPVHVDELKYNRNLVQNPFYAPYTNLGDY